MRIHITATIMPSPDQLRAGMLPDKYAMDSDTDNVADRVRTLLATAVGNGVFEAAGTVVLMVQPDYRTAN